MKFRKTMVAGTAIALAGVLAACGSNASSSKGTSITRMESDVISTMDPSTNTDAIAGQALIDTMDGLYRYSGSDLKPAIAKSEPKVTDGGKTYTFKLRNAKWSNGDAVLHRILFLLGGERLILRPSLSMLICIPA